MPSSISELMLFRMNLLKDYIQTPKTRAEQNQRREEIANLVNIAPATVKSYYLYGQGPMEKWDIITSHITKVEQETVIDLYTCRPYLAEELEKLPRSKATLLSYISQLSDAEIKLLNGVIELCLKANKIGNGSN